MAASPALAASPAAPAPATATAIATAPAPTGPTAADGDTAAAGGGLASASLAAPGSHPHTRSSSSTSSRAAPSMPSEAGAPVIPRRHARAPDGRAPRWPPRSGPAQPMVCLPAPRSKTTSSPSSYTVTVRAAPGALPPRPRVRRPALPRCCCYFMSGLLAWHACFAGGVMVVLGLRPPRRLPPASGPRVVEPVRRRRQAAPWRGAGATIYVCLSCGISQQACYWLPCTFCSGRLPATQRQLRGGDVARAACQQAAQGMFCGRTIRSAVRQLPSAVARLRALRARMRLRREHVVVRQLAAVAALGGRAVASRTEPESRVACSPLLAFARAKKLERSLVQQALLTQRVLDGGD
jgi:hypothetical protein